MAVDWSQTGGVSVANLQAQGVIPSTSPLALDPWTLQGLGIDGSGIVGGAGSSAVPDPLCPAFSAKFGLCTPHAAAANAPVQNPGFNWACALNPLAACFWSSGGGPLTTITGDNSGNTATTPGALTGVAGKASTKTNSVAAGCAFGDVGCSLKAAFPNIQADISALVTNAGWLVLGIILVALGIWALVKP